MRAGSRFVPWSLALVLTSAAFGQSGVKVEVDDVTDNRMAAEMFSGSLDLRLKLSGTGLEKVAATRFLVKEAKDDRGTVLTKPGGDTPDFQSSEYNSGMITVSLRTPARTASSVKVKGTVELFVPSRDPNAYIKVEKALAKLDAPLTSKSLKSAKITITPLSHERYAAMLESRKLTEEKIAELREEGRKQGAPEKEIEMLIGLAQALEGLDGPPSEGAIILSGKKTDFDRILKIDVLGADGKPMETSGNSSSTRGEDTLMTLNPRETPPANAALQLTVLTEKAKMSVPFEMTIPLP